MPADSWADLGASCLQALCIYNVFCLTSSCLRFITSRLFLSTLFLRSATSLLSWKLVFSSCLIVPWTSVSIWWISPKPGLSTSNMSGNLTSANGDAITRVTLCSSEISDVKSKIFRSFTRKPKTNTKKSFRRRLLNWYLLQHKLIKCWLLILLRKIWWPTFSTRPHVFYTPGHHTRVFHLAQIDDTFMTECMAKIVYCLANAG